MLTTMNAFDLVVPLILLGAAAWALYRRVDVYEAITTGAAEGLGTVTRIFPNLVCLLTAIYMLRASGAMESFASLLSPLFDRLGIPAELVPLMVIRPVSGSGALAIGAELIEAHGPDSLIGRTAAVMLGGTETTFYTIAVYFGAAKVSETRYAIPAALFADLVGFILAALTTRWWFF
ncbi:MAG: spore maturation protein [Oscillospiraceae bacterium]|nr:spore maturation protein [Oscillospiraceae bacterium]